MFTNAAVSVQPPGRRIRWLRSRAFILLVLVLAAGLAGYHLAQFAARMHAPRAVVPGVLWPDGITLRQFALTDHRGERFDLDRLRGRWTLMTFGYTFCPDVCPMTLGKLNTTLGLLEEEVDVQQLQTVFVSVDPARDSEARLADWIGYFNPQFVAVRGNESELLGLSTQVAATFRALPADDNGYYAVSHTASVMLIDPRARLVAILGLPLYAEDVAARVSEIIADAND